MIGTPATDDPVWYVAYASNLSAGRLRCYLQGGRPPGARRTYEGCRDPSPPTRETALTLSGDLVFAGRSSVWGGAMAFYDASTQGEIVARGYQITFGQLSDLVSQEARQPVGRDLQPGEDVGRPWPTASSVYESVVYLGDRDGHPMFCLTSQQVLDPAPPSAAYLRTILLGLHEAFGWTPLECAHYLLRARGVSPAWSKVRISALMVSRPGPVCCAVLPRRIGHGRPSPFVPRWNEALPGGETPWNSPHSRCLVPTATP